MIVRVTVPGAPQPQGSTRGFIGRGKAAGRVIITTDNPQLYPWRLAVQLCSRKAWGHRPLESGPVRLQMVFTLPRPRGHFGKRGLLPSAPMMPTVKPDCDKLIRGVLDGLKGAVYRDDAQVTRIDAMKHYEDPAHKPGLELSIIVADIIEAKEIA